MKARKTRGSLEYTTRGFSFVAGVCVCVCRWGEYPGRGPANCHRLRASASTRTAPATGLRCLWFAARSGPLMKSVGHRHRLGCVHHGHHYSPGL